MKIVTANDPLKQAWAVFLDMPEKTTVKGKIKTNMVEYHYVGHRIWKAGETAQSTIYGIVWDNTPIQYITEPDRVPMVFPKKEMAQEFARMVLVLDRFKTRNIWDEIDHKFLKTFNNDNGNEGSKILV